MDFVLNDEQRSLQAKAAELVKRAADRDPHKMFAEAGWLSLMVPERAGGSGFGIAEMALVLEQAGRGLMTGPLTACSVSAYAIGIGRAATVREKTLEELVAGSRLIVPALQDPAAPEEAQERITAMPFHYGYQLSGGRSRVPFAADADAFLIDARTSDGSIMLIIPSDIHGVDISETESADDTRYGTVNFSDASMMSDEWLIAGARQGATLTAASYDRLLLGTSAEMLGVMEGALAYVEEQEASRQANDSLQALQQQAANDRSEIERLRSRLYEVCTAFDTKRGTRSMVAEIKAQASELVLRITKSVVQIQEASGVANKARAGLFLKRAMALSVSYGDATLHRKRHAALLESETAAATGGAGTRRKRPRRKKSIFAKAVSR